MRRCTSATVPHHLDPRSLPPPLSCFIHDDVTFYVSVVAYAVLIFLFNIAVRLWTVILKTWTKLATLRGQHASALTVITSFRYLWWF